MQHELVQAKPNAVAGQRRRRFATEELDARDLVRQIAIAVVQQLAGEAALRALDLDPAMGIAPDETRERAPEQPELPIGMEIAVADPAAEMIGRPIDLIGGGRSPRSSGRGRARPASRRQAPGSPPRRDRARRPSRAGPATRRSASARRRPRTPVARPATPAVGPRTRFRPGSSRRRRRRSRPPTRPTRGSARAPALRRRRAGRR